MVAPSGDDRGPSDDSSAGPCFQLRGYSAPDPSTHLQRAERWRVVTDQRAGASVGRIALGPGPGPGALELAVRRQQSGLVSSITDNVYPAVCGLGVDSDPWLARAPCRRS
jgi:hypothetical protein